MRRSIFIVLHTLAIFTISFSLLSGLRIGSLDKPYLLSIAMLLPEGQIHSLHLISGMSLLVLACYYCYFKLAHRKVIAQSFYHKLVTWFGYTIILISLLSGVLLRLDWLPQSLLPIHYLSAIALILYLLLHSWVYLLQLGRNAFRKILFIPLKRMPFRLTGGLIICICASYYYTQSLTHTLSVSPIAAEVLMEIDGYDNEPQWLDAPIFFVDTNHGANFVDGNTQVAIKALSNAQETFFLFRWADPTQSLRHLPLIKTQSGWKVQENGFYHFDEQSYYEDKFAVMLSNSCSFGADGTSYLGKQPFNSYPANWHGKGYHASLDGKIRDLWHWKAVRTNDMVLADDNFFGPLVTPLSAERRYKAGYQTDGKESGSYVMNWQWYSKNQVTPKRLPNQNTEISQPVLPWFGSHPYQKEHDIYPSGTQLSSVLYRSNRFEGDRADVRAKGRWQDGYWTLELVRKNKTASPHDIELANHTCMWVSAFDSSQIAHTRHQRAIKLRYAL